MKLSYSKIIILLFTSVCLVVFWDSSFMVPLKLFVVYIHEISHAMAALLTGGDVTQLSFNIDESGYTTTRGGNFLLIVSSGYPGSILIGSLMLHAGVNGRFSFVISILLGMIILLFTVFIPEQIEFNVLIMGILWAAVFIILPFSGQYLYRSMLFFMGSLTSLYAIFDLSDFFRGQIENTDAGIIAHHFFPGSHYEIYFSYFIAIFLSVFSIIIYIRFLISTIYHYDHTAMDHDDNVHSDIPNAENQPVLDVSKLHPDVIQLLIKLQSQDKPQNLE